MQAKPTLHCYRCGQFVADRQVGGTDDDRGRLRRKLLCQRCADGPRPRRRKGGRA